MLSQFDEMQKDIIFISPCSLSGLIIFMNGIVVNTTQYILRQILYSVRLLITATGHASL